MAFGRHRLCLLAPLLAAAAFAHPLEFGQQPTYADMPPAAGAEDIANWIGAPYDAANVGGSGVNADGGADNGVANDGLTYVRQGGSICGQTFTTGANPDGYRLDSITVRVAEYPDNIASIANGTAWSLDFTNGPVIVGISKVNGTTLARQSQQWFSWGGIDNPGSGQAVNGPGSAITFTLPYTTYLDPDTEYAFDFFAGRDSQSEFEWDGTIADHYAGGTAYTRSGTTLTPSAAAMPLSREGCGNSGSPPPSSEIGNTAMPYCSESHFRVGAMRWQYGQSERKKKKIPHSLASPASVSLALRERWLSRT